MDLFLLTVLNIQRTIFDIHWVLVKVQQVVLHIQRQHAQHYIN